jgi:hypothetical protein
VQRIGPVEFSMLLGVAVVVFSLAISTLAAVVVDTAYQALIEKRWPAALQMAAVLVVLVATA